jgi:outer membrane protein assembly factor BamB
MRTLALLLPAVALAAGCASTTTKSPPRLDVDWTLDGFANPESVLPAADGRFLYVSNVAGEGDARDGNGFIARISPDGKMLEREWARGLDGPKGLGLHDGTLFVADITRVVALDAATGAERARYDAPGAKFLNDVAVLDDGTVLVSDSGTARIFALRDGRLETWLEHDLLRAVNGLLPERGRLVVTTMQGRLLAVDMQTRAVATLAEGLANADGVVALGRGEYLVGEWPGRLFHVRADGTSTTLLDSREQKVYLNDFLRVGDRLLVPNWEPSRVTAYRIER